MRNLKKILALVLALMMTVSLMVVASAANIDNYDDKEEISDKYAVAVEVLSGIGIYQGDGAGEDTFRPQDSLSRAEVATLLYRLLSGDVNGDKVNTYAGHDEFSDVTPEAWYAGYINYAYINGWVIGNGDGTYGPDDNVTGEELATMLVRALGRDANGEEISGDDWALEASVLAAKLGLIDNLGGLFLLSDDITREQTAQMIFNALNAETWKYNGLIYKQNTTTLGEEQLGLACNEDAHDIWGRPQTEWSTTAAGTVATFPETPVATYDVAVSECDIALDLDQDDDFTLDVYTNGVKKAGVDFDPLHQAKTIGAQGTWIEVYADELVIIDTYLARVDAVHEATTDSEGHPATAAYSELNVWRTTKNAASSMVMDSTDYSVGSYILVNYNEANKTVYDVQEAEAFNGTQTRIWTNASQHTIDGKTYDDAEHYLKDSAGSDGSESYTWFLDQFGNVIGSAEINRISYAVLKDIIWEVGTPGYAEATLVDMNGNETTVVVDEFDGIVLSDPAHSTDGNWATNLDNEEPALDDEANVSFPGVSSDSKYNGFYEGYALYRVYTNDNGTVDLDGIDGNDTYVEFDHAAMIDTDTHRIVTHNGTFIVDDSTQFLVKNAGNTYTAYTLSTIPSFANSAVIYYTVGSDNIADRVYVKSGVEKAELGNYLYVTTDNYHQLAGTNDYYMNVVIDGVERTIATTETIVKYLAANEDKVFGVSWELNPYDHMYGFVNDARLVNEAVDRSWSWFGDINYLTGDVTFADGVIVNDGESYRINSDTVFVGGNAVNDSVYADNGIWVDYSSDGKQLVADVVYIGAKLDTSVALTVASKYGTVSYNGTTITVTSKEDATSDELTYIANDANSVVVLHIDPVVVGLYSVSDTVYYNNNSRSVTVYNEAGTNDETYTINLVWTDEIVEDAITTVKSSGGNVTLGGATNPMDMYRDFDAAVANAVVLERSNVGEISIYADNNIVVADIDASNSAYHEYYAKSHRFTSTGDATEETFAGASNIDFTNGKSAAINVADWDADDVYVLCMYVRDNGIDGIAYFAFQVK